MAARESTRLLAWYDREKRDLPWRKTSDPYEILVSEIMLQQTTVATVIPRWRQFLERFPSVTALAMAEEADVVHEWTGLGYYRRAKNLRKAAISVVEDYGGNFPERAKELKNLPGVGDYTAAAVASIAFADAKPVLDANVERVLARVLAFEENPRTGAAKKYFREVLETWIPANRPGDFNQAMMELGATVCTPKAPRCGACPLASHCEALTQSRVEDLPRLPQKKPMEEVTEAGVVLRDDRGRLLLLKRPEEVSLGGMWEPPKVCVNQGEEVIDAAVRAARELTGLEIRLGSMLFQTTHTIMRRRIRLHLFAGHIIGGEVLSPCHESAEWLTLERWSDLPKSTTMAKFLKHFKKTEGSVTPDLFNS